MVNYGAGIPISETSGTEARHVSHRPYSESITTKVRAIIYFRYRHAGIDILVPARAVFYLLDSSVSVAEGMIHMSRPGSQSEEYVSFDEQPITDITNAIVESQKGADAPTKIEVEAACIDIVVKNNQICLHLPAPISKDVCIRIPTPIPDGTVARVCLNICYHVIPTGVCAIVTVLGKTFKFCWGWC
jgi:hypothetical protein